MYIAGIDIGGTTCGVSLAYLKKNNGEVDILDKIEFSTPDTPDITIENFVFSLKKLLNRTNIDSLKGIGISCGGPLDVDRGLILSPPNLPGWDEIDIITPFKKEFEVPAALQNDANAGALAEWYFGAGKGCSHLIFLTFGTGMGAGLILNGSLYSGISDMAGEVGHIRLEEKGPVGYGKAGSFEGFCSGGGIARLARAEAEKAIKKNKPPLFCSNPKELDSITAKKIGKAAQKGDELARKIFEIAGEKLGYGLSILIDILNPEKIIIGSIYGRQKSLLEPVVKRKLKEEALDLSLSVCEIVPAALGEDIGNYAGISVIIELLKEKGIINGFSLQLKK
ncbi:MAG: ROK family protein [Halanaerobiaceae bacterium]